MADAERSRDKFFLASRVALTDVCARLREEFNLPEFEADHENENEWATSTSAAIAVRVSRAYKPDTFHGWNAACPPGCNYSVEVTVLAGAPGDWNDAVKAGWREGWASVLAELADGGVQQAPS